MVIHPFVDRRASPDAALLVPYPGCQQRGNTTLAENDQKGLPESRADRPLNKYGWQKIREEGAVLKLGNLRVTDGRKQGAGRCFFYAGNITPSVLTVAAALGLTQSTLSGVA